MGEKFVSAFNQINESFNKVFRNCSAAAMRVLILPTPKTPGIRSGNNCAPSGEKLQQLSLLSEAKSPYGHWTDFRLLKGEACSFCVFDEIEAALDEANLTRFLITCRGLPGKHNLYLFRTAKNNGAGRHSLRCNHGRSRCFKTDFRACGQ